MLRPPLALAPGTPAASAGQRRRSALTQAALKGSHAEECRTPVRATTPLGVWQGGRAAGRWRARARRRPARGCRTRHRHQRNPRAPDFTFLRRSKRQGRAASPSRGLGAAARRRRGQRHGRLCPASVWRAERARGQLAARTRATNTSDGFTKSSSNQRRRRCAEGAAAIRRLQLQAAHRQAVNLQQLAGRPKRATPPKVLQPERGARFLDAER